MKIKDKSKKKAVFLTLSMFLLVTAVLALAIVVFHYTSQERIERTAEISSLDRLYDLSGSVENSLLQIFNLYSDVRASIEENPDGTTNVSITEKIISHDGWGKEFGEEVGNFEAFVDGQDENVELDLDVIGDKELPIIISPHNITYSRDWGEGHPTLYVVPETPETPNFGSYSILIDSGDVKIKDITPPSGAAGSFYFGVRAIDAHDYDETKGKWVKPGDKYTIKVFFVEHKVTITLDNNELEIWTNSKEPITVTTTIDNLEKRDEKVRIGYLKGAINVTLPNLGVSKISSILID